MEEKDVICHYYYIGIEVILVFGFEMVNVKFFFIIFSGSVTLYN